MVLTHNGQLINAWFHADAGGLTAGSAEEGLAFKQEATPYIHSVEDPGSEITLEENRYWSASFPIEEVKQAVINTAGFDPGEITSAKIIERGPSGRVTKVTLGNATISGPALRLALGSTKMRSTLWHEISIQNGQLLVNGRGYGHGVGMSQWGARALGEKGEKPENIAKYFFKDVEVKHLWK